MPYLRAKVSLCGLHQKWAEEFIKKKFKDPSVVAGVREILGKGYKKVLILGSYSHTKPDKEKETKDHCIEV